MFRGYSRGLRGLKDWFEGHEKSRNETLRTDFFVAMDDFTAYITPSFNSKRFTYYLMYTFENYIFMEANAAIGIPLSIIVSFTTPHIGRSRHRCQNQRYFRK